jgi:hypothetical protein
MIFVIPLRARTPVAFVYELTLPSKRLAEFVASTTITELPGIYASPVPTERLAVPPWLGAGVVALTVAVL